MASVLKNIAGFAVSVNSVVQGLFMSADMASLCSICVHVNNLSKSTRPTDMQLLLKDTLSIDDDKS